MLTSVVMYLSIQVGSVNILSSLIQRKVLTINRRKVLFSNIVSISMLLFCIFHCLFVYIQTHLAAVSPVTNMSDTSRLQDTSIADAAIHFIRQRSAFRRPFFLAVGFHRPHLPFWYPAQFESKLLRAKLCSKMFALLKLRTLSSTLVYLQ